MEQIYNTIIWFTIAIQVERKVKSYQSFKRSTDLSKKKSKPFFYQIYIYETSNYHRKAFISSLKMSINNVIYSMEKKRFNIS